MAGNPGDGKPKAPPPKAAPLIKGLPTRKPVAPHAKPGPPVGAALGQAGLKIMDFTKDFNAKTAEIDVRPAFSTSVAEGCTALVVLVVLALTCMCQKSGMRISVD